MTLLRAVSAVDAGSLVKICLRSRRTVTRVAHVRFAAAQTAPSTSPIQDPYPVKATTSRAFTGVLFCTARSPGYQRHSQVRDAQWAASHARVAHARNVLLHPAAQPLCGEPGLRGNEYLSAKHAFSRAATVELSLDQGSDLACLELAEVAFGRVGLRHPGYCRRKSERADGQKFLSPC